MHKIIPLNVGTLEALPKQTCMYRMYRDVTYEAPCVMWYITDTKDNIIVDLGPPDPQQVLENHGFIMHRTPEQQPLSALTSIGVNPLDVRTVIVTHLHWDHAWGFHLFKNARFILQRKEVEYAIAPLPCHKTLYYEKNLGKPQFVDFLERIMIIDGDYRVEKDVDAISIPSHSPGFQGVSVAAGKLTFFIGGDAIGLYECWENVPHIPSGIFNNLNDYYLSMNKIEQIADHILPGHDFKVFEKTSYPL
ncbi:MAG: N-acyl homoserine lactonase family protein [Thermodesulfobacteriota bacterium]